MAWVLKVENPDDAYRKLYIATFGRIHVHLTQDQGHAKRYTTKDQAKKAVKKYQQDCERGKYTGTTHKLTPQETFHV